MEMFLISYLNYFHITFLYEPKNYYFWRSLKTLKSGWTRRTWFKRTTIERGSNAISARPHNSDHAPAWSIVPADVDNNTNCYYSALARANRVILFAHQYSMNSDFKCGRIFRGMEAISSFVIIYFAAILM